MKKRIYIIIAILVPILLIAALIIFVKPPFRVVLYNRGAGAVETEVQSIGKLSIEFDGFKAKIAPLWKQPDVDIIIKEHLYFHDDVYQAGDRLTSDGHGNLIKQKWYQTLLNDIRYYAWKVKQPRKRKVERKPLFVRAKEVSLRSRPSQGVPEAGVIQFGAELKPLEQKGDWRKVREIQSNKEGWIHRSVTTESKEQIDALRSDKSRIPGLVLLIIAQDATHIQTTTLAGGLVIPEDKASAGDFQPELQPKDCLIFDEATIDYIPKPFNFLGYTIEKPLAGKIYFLNESGVIEILDLISLK